MSPHCGPPHRSQPFCAGWAAIGITLAYAFIWLQIADVAKVLVQRVFNKYDKVKVREAREGGQLS